MTPRTTTRARTIPIPILILEVLCVRRMPLRIPLLVHLFQRCGACAVSGKLVDAGVLEFASGHMIVE